MFSQLAGGGGATPKNEPLAPGHEDCFNLRKWGHNVINPMAVGSCRRERRASIKEEVHP